MILNLKVYYQYIIFLLFALLPVDMVNGVLMENNINLPISFGQLFKLVILMLLLVRLYFVPKTLDLILILLGCLFLSSVVQSVSTFDFTFLFNDFIKVSKYLTPFIAFLFFKKLVEEQDEFLMNKLFRWISFSYWVLAFNIFIKLFHLGYSMYENEIGTRGFFYAGNEVSALLLILASILAYKYWVIENQKFKFLLFLFFNLFLGVLISSKTGILGIALIFVLIVSDLNKINIKLKTIKMILVSATIIIPLVLYFTYKSILKSPVMVRFEYFWEKLDLVTFIFSSRNIFAEKMFGFYEVDFTVIQKIIGGGQFYYETKLGHIIEIDILDIFFAYGYLGAIIFCLFLALTIIYSYFLKQNPANEYARLTYIMSIMLFFVSSIAGHVFNSGMAGIFIGFLFSLMFYKRNEVQNSI